MEAIKTYLKEIRRIPLLKPEEELKLAKRVKAGDEEARKKMIRSNLRLVINIAKRYIHFGIPLMDLIEEGNMGLMKAVDKFNYKRRLRFSTYAAWWIRQSIGRAISEQGKLIRIPVYMSDLITRWKKTKERLTQKLCRAPYPREIAKVLRVPVERVRQINTWITKTSSLDAPIGEEGEDQIIDLIKDVSTKSPDREISKEFEKENLSLLLDQMNDRERKVLDMRFGLTDGIPRTLAHIAKKERISRERIRQIEESALKKLRKFVKIQEKEKIWWKKEKPTL